MVSNHLQIKILMELGNIRMTDRQDQKSHHLDLCDKIIQLQIIYDFNLNNVIYNHLTSYTLHSII